jgi:hypothetical protein
VLYVLIQGEINGITKGFTNRYIVSVDFINANHNMAHPFFKPDYHKSIINATTISLIIGMEDNWGLLSLSGGSAQSISVFQESIALICLI